jgi:hypothetical protein
LYFVKMTAHRVDFFCLPWSFIFSINCLMLRIKNLTKILSLMCCLLWQHIELTSLMCCHGIFKHAVRFYHYWRGHNQLFRISMQIYKPQRDGIDSSLIVGLPFKHAVNFITIEGVVYNLLLCNFYENTCHFSHTFYS